jgi:hypothetical protein
LLSAFTLALVSAGEETPIVTLVIRGSTRRSRSKISPTFQRRKGVGHFVVTDLLVIALARFIVEARHT